MVGTVSSINHVESEGCRCPYCSVAWLVDDLFNDSEQDGFEIIDAVTYGLIISLSMAPLEHRGPVTHAMMAKIDTLMGQYTNHMTRSAEKH